ncbi:MAG TPA: ferritin-like domain-containing protein [Thermosynergistes sp.]|nr:ferritin-like domain-containing protein [Thermosynergistes sp.]HPZ76548.1 ferritin-like domain-containing protein [Thermosynergistes sp.]
MYHEPVEELSSKDRDIHRALVSLKEEVEAVDWYHQRAATASDDAVKAIIEHNRNEEMEHASMLLEWLRRNVPEWDEALRTYLFTEEPITEIEASAAGEEETSSRGSLDIGSLKQ